MCIVVDTEAVAPAQRVEFWHRLMLEFFQADMRIAAPSSEPVRAIARMHTFGTMHLMQLTGDALRMLCAPAPDGPDVLALVPLSGSCVIDRPDGALVLSPGSVGLLSCHAALEMCFSEWFGAIVVGMPRHRVPHAAPFLDTAGARLLRSDNDAAALFTSFVTALATHHEELSGLENVKTGNRIIELLDTAIRLQSGSRRFSQRDCHHRERIVKLIAQELRNPALDIAFIARSVGLSSRHVYRLFAQDEVSIMQSVLQQRLDGCLQELAQPLGDVRTIGEIAFSWGFNDQAHFSRTFRKRFGITPRAARAGVKSAAR